MQRRRPLLPFDYQPPQGLDIEAQAVAPQAMQMPVMPPPMQFAPMLPPDDSMKQLAQMGTQRALAHFLNTDEDEDEPNGLRRRKKSASATDALSAWEAGGSL